MQVNKQLDKMGYNIGVRMIEDFLAHTPSAKRCTQFEEVADVICKQGFRMFLGNVTKLLYRHLFFDFAPKLCPDGVF